MREGPLVRGLNRRYSAKRDSGGLRHKSLQYNHRTLVGPPLINIVLLTVYDV